MPRPRPGSRARRRPFAPERHRYSETSRSPPLLRELRDCNAASGNWPTVSAPRPSRSDHVIRARIESGRRLPGPACPSSSAVLPCATPPLYFALGRGPPRRIDHEAPRLPSAAGDGTGPEVIREAPGARAAARKFARADFTPEIWGARYLRTGETLPDRSSRTCARSSDYPARRHPASSRASSRRASCCACASSWTSTSTCAR
jgi:hypothetical protein